VLDACTMQGSTPPLPWSAATCKPSHHQLWLEPGEARPFPLQAEVEDYYVRRGYLIPNYHKVYWMGLTTNATTWPRFTWLDRSQPGA
jgi:hypothetical protein